MTGISKTLIQLEVLEKHYRRSLLGFASVWSTLNTIWRAIWSTLNAIWRAIWSTLNAIWRTFTLQSRLRAFLRLDSMEDANACLGPDSIWDWLYSANANVNAHANACLGPDSIRDWLYSDTLFIATAFIFGPVSMGIVFYSAAITVLCHTWFFGD